MPKRSNDFQKMVTLIETQLVSGEGHVTESKMVWDSIDEMEREIDIVIETEIGGHAVTIGIECRDRSRPADVTWVDEMIGKHRNLDLGKSVLVSRSGFTKSARTKATNNNIDTYTLEKALDVDWAKQLDSLSKQNVKIESFMVPFVTSITVLASEQNTTLLNEQELSDMVLCNASGDTFGTLFAYIDNILSGPDIAEKIMQHAFTDADTLVKFTLLFQGGEHLRDNDGQCVEIKGVNVTARCKKRIGSLKLKRGTYRGEQVAAGVGKLSDKDDKGLVLAAVQRPGESVEISFRAPAKIKL